MFKLFKKLLDVYGGIGKRLKAGFEHEAGIVSVPMAASVPIVNWGGRFVTTDASGYAALTGSASTTIFGSIEDAAQTSSATKGTTVLNCCVNPSAIYRVPINSGTASVAYLGKALTLTTSAGTQGVLLGTTSTAHVICVDIDTVNSAWIDVKISPTILIGR